MRGPLEKQKEKRASRINCTRGTQILLIMNACGTDTNINGNVVGSYTIETIMKGSQFEIFQSIRKE